MPAGGGSSGYYEPKAPPPPSPPLAVVLVGEVRRPEAVLPTGYLGQLLQCGIITTNEALLVLESWAEYHAFPSIYSPDPF